MQRTTFCCHCEQPAMPDAPIPLCGTCIRETYEFAQAVVDERWVVALAEVAAEDDRVPPPAVRVQVEGWGRTSVVYFVRLGQRVKIGWSTHLRARLASIPYEEVLGVMPGTYADEQALHRLFHAQRVVGEWFKDCGSIRQYVADHCG